MDGHYISFARNTTKGGQKSVSWLLIDSKRRLKLPPILAYPKIGSKFIVDSDACDMAVGAVLSQDQDGEENVIAYMSKSMNVHERAYCIPSKHSYNGPIMGI